MQCNTSLDSDPVTSKPKRISPGHGPAVKGGFLIDFNFKIHLGEYNGTGKKASQKQP